MRAALDPRLTYDDLPDDGRRWELLDGVPRVTPSPLLGHQAILWRLGRAFEAALEEGDRFFVAPLDVVLAPGTSFQPDLVLVLAANRGILQGVVRGVPDLVVEVVSPTTASYDRGAKKRSYARHGVPEMWIVDGEAETIEIYRLPARAGRIYRRAALHGRGQRAGTPALPRLAVDLDSLFTE